MPRKLHRAHGVSFLLLSMTLGSCGSRTELLPATQPDADAGVIAIRDAQVVMPPLQGCDACPEETLSWGWQGGLVAFTERLSLTPCPSFERIRTPAGFEMPDARCFGDLSCTSDAPEEVSAESLGRLIANEELRSLFNSSDSTLFGRDSRPVDGSLLSVSLGEQSLLIGDECPPESDCRTIPEPLSELREMLIALDQQMRRVERCLETAD